MFKLAHLTNLLTWWPRWPCPGIPHHTGILLATALAAITIQGAPSPDSGPSPLHHTVTSRHVQTCWLRPHYTLIPPRYIQICSVGPRHRGIASSPPDRLESGWLALNWNAFLFISLLIISFIRCCYDTSCLLNNTWCKLVLEKISS